MKNDVFHSFLENSLTDFLEGVNRRLKFDKWFFGHYHLDERPTDKHIAIYHHIIKYEKGETL